jgi:hypothetical protein
MTPCSLVGTKTRFEQTASIFEMLWLAAQHTSERLGTHHPSKTKDVIIQAITLLTFEMPQNILNEVILGNVMITTTMMMINTFINVPA